MATKAEVKKERDQLQKKIEGGKLKGKALKKATGRMYYLNGRLKHSFSSAAPKVKATRKAKAKKIDPNQGFLPNFLSQLNVARIEELVADRAFNAVAPQLEKQLGITLKKEKVG